MQLYLISYGFDNGRPSVAEALRESAAYFPGLAGEAVEDGASADGTMQYATIGHPAAVAAPRRYVARRGDEVVILDGLPIDRLGQFPASDSEQLLDRWSDLPSRLEGLFSAVRI